MNAMVRDTEPIARYRLWLVNHISGTWTICKADDTELIELDTLKGSTQFALYNFGYGACK